jgi:hypothetical protein
MCLAADPSATTDSDVSIQIPLGSQAPAALTVQITSYDPSLDLTTVTAVVLSVLRQTDGITATWSATITGTATTTLLQVTYTFASDGSDFPVLGPYAATPILTVPGGQVLGTVVGLFCVLPNDFTSAGYQARSVAVETFGAQATG